MKTSRSIALLAFLALTLMPEGLQSQDARVRTEVDTTQVTVGDRIRMTVAVDHAAGARVVWPDSVDLAPFEVLRAELLAPANEGDRVRSGAVFTLAAFELGELEIPSFGLEVVGPGDASESVATDRFGIEVVSVGADEGGDIRDIRGTLWIPVSVVGISLWLLLAVAALGMALWLFRRRRSANHEPRRPAAPPLPAHEIALDALARIERSPMLERGQVKEYHVQVSEVLRTYLEARFVVPALEMTTSEVVRGLAAADVDPHFVQELRRFLDQCDLVKFAKVRPSKQDAEATLALGRELVRASIPAEEGPAEPVSADPVAASAAAEAAS